jgi:hypothetical protein
VLVDMVEGEEEEEKEDSVDIYESYGSVTMQRWGLVLYIGRTMSTAKELQSCGESRQITEAQLRNIRIRRLYIGSK